MFTFVVPAFWMVNIDVGPRAQVGEPFLDGLDQDGLDQLRTRSSRSRGASKTKASWTGRMIRASRPAATDAGGFRPRRRPGPRFPARSRCPGPAVRGCSRPWSLCGTGGGRKCTHSPSGLTASGLAPCHRRGPGRVGRTNPRAPGHMPARSLGPGQSRESSGRR